MWVKTSKYSVFFAIELLLLFTILVTKSNAFPRMEKTSLQLVYNSRVNAFEWRSWNKPSKSALPSVTKQKDATRLSCGTLITGTFIGARTLVQSNLIPIQTILPILHMRGCEVSNSYSYISFMIYKICFAKGVVGVFLVSNTVLR